MNFNELLQKELDEYEEENKKIDLDNICLISKDPLDSSKITLECNHTFNYVNLFNEIVNQKTVDNYKEVQKLKLYSIKCPYCRSIQNKILPYVSGYKKIKYVNWPPEMSMKNYTNKCRYVFLSGKKKGNECGCGCFETFCPRHKKIVEKRKKKQAEQKKKHAEQKKKQEKKIKEMKKSVGKYFKNLLKDEEKKKAKKPKIPKLVSLSPVKFECSCEHVFSRGANKNKRCKKRVIVKVNYNGNFVMDNYYCNQHLKLSKNVSKYVEAPKTVSVKLSKKIKDLVPEEYFELFLKKYYKYYKKNDKYDYDKDSNMFILKNID